MTPVVALALAACIATSRVEDIPASDVQRACGERIQAVHLEGDHHHIILEMEFAIDMQGVQVAGGPLAPLAKQTAIESWRIFSAAYPCERFTYQIRDSRRRPVCQFEFTNTSEPVSAMCVLEVNDPDGTEERW